MLSCSKVNRYLALQEQAHAIGKLDLDAVESTVLSSIRKGGEPSEHNSHKRHKGVKIVFAQYLVDLLVMGMRLDNLDIE